MTKKSLLFLVLCICISIGAVSQVTQTNKIIKKTGLLTAGFYQNNQKLNWKSLNNVVANDQKATEILQSVKDQQMIGSALSLGGAGLMCVGAAVSFVNTIQNIQRLSAGQFPRTSSAGLGILLVGGAAYFASVPFSIKVAKAMDRAVNEYNSTLGGIAGRVQPMELNFGLTSNGVGMVLRF